MKEINITDIKGIEIGQAQNFEAGTGCTAVIAKDGACAGVDVRGGGPASRETDCLRAENMIDRIHCVMLSGGSAYGLEAACGAMDYLEEQGVGFDVGVAKVPIVCGCSLFDLTVGSSSVRPDKAMGYEACKNATNEPPLQGNYGAGTGASVGKYFGMNNCMKSGIGHYAVQAGEVQCGAIVAVNALGDVIDVETNKIMAGLLNDAQTEFIDTNKVMFEEISGDRDVWKGNTSLGCVITNAKLTKAQCNKLASIAHNGYAKAIRPVHTSADGDTIYVLSTGEVNVSPDALGALATEVMAKAINNALRHAKAAYGLKCAADFKK